MDATSMGHREKEQSVKGFSLPGLSMEAPAGMKRRRSRSRSRSRRRRRRGGEVTPLSRKPLVENHRL